MVKLELYPNDLFPTAESQRALRKPLLKLCELCASAMNIPYPLLTLNSNSRIVIDKIIYPKTIFVTSQ